MSPRRTARRARAASAAVLSAALLGGCAYAQAGTLAEGPAQPEASTTSAAAALGTSGAGTVDSAGALSAAVDAERNAVDEAFVAEAVEHHRLTVALADVVLGESRVSDDLTSLAVDLRRQQQNAGVTLTRLADLWADEAPAGTGTDSVADGDARPAYAAAHQITRDNLELLFAQADSDGLVPFWVLTTQLHQESLVESAERAADLGRSATVRRVARQFLADTEGARPALGAQAR